jgi:hypothetical protein
MIHTIDLRRWALQTVDEGLHAFDRGSGENVLVRNRHTACLQRTAPRVLQIGLLTPCNLHCDFCYRDTNAPSRLDAPFLLDLLTRAAQWGVLEVAFGGGEPLLFRGFVDMVEELHQATPLGINFTTNGTLLTEDLLARLRRTVGEMRISAYPDNRYRRSLLMARGMNVGVNWLVTPANVGMIEPFVYDFLELVSNTKADQKPVPGTPILVLNLLSRSRFRNSESVTLPHRLPQSDLHETRRKSAKRASACNDANQSAIDFHEDGRKSAKCPCVCNDANQSHDDFHENRRKSGKCLCVCNENQIPEREGLHPGTAFRRRRRCRADGAVPSAGGVGVYMSGVVCSALAIWG